MSSTAPKSARRMSALATLTVAYERSGKSASIKVEVAASRIQLRPVISAAKALSVSPVSIACEAKQNNQQRSGMQMRLG